MYKRKKSRKRQTIMIITVSILIIIMICINFILPDRNLGTVEKVLKDSALFVEKIVVAPVNFFKNLFKPSNKTSAKEYQKLLEDSEKLSSTIAERDEAEYQLKELKALLELNSTLVDKKYLNATVINRNLGYWYNTITIDKGSSSGLEPNMAVIVPGGVIGQISKVSNFNSTVKLLTGIDQNSKLSVKIQIGEEYLYGLLVGYNKENDTYLIEGISDNLEISIGSVVITTGMGENIPAGILIGKVSGVTTDNFDLAQIVEVKSDIDFNNITYVTVLKKGSGE